jgi:tRNA-2-methylthio-N6-dimethylallyladenosine synthase
MRYHIVSLGCQMNKSDSERVDSVIEKMGFQYTDKEDDADLLGVIACSVRQKAIDKVYSKISKWNKWKNKKNLLTFVSGCILPSDREKFMKLFDIVFPMGELPQLREMIEQYGIVTPVSLQRNETDYEKEPTHAIDLESINQANQSTFANLDQRTYNKKLIENINDFWHVKPKYSSGFDAFIPIQNGCDKFCTFCAVPYTRGREVSRPSSEILAELKRLVDEGYKSITLLGQNVNSYGLDKKGEEISFTKLLEKIGEYGKTSGKDFWVYFTSPHPRDMTDEVIEVIAKYPVLAKQIHLPIQSGDDKLLIKMNRNHSVEKYRQIVHTIKRLIPEATLFTDIIVGFTTETEEQFENTRKVMQEFQYHMAYIAQYSVRPGAAASRWNDTVSKEDKSKRFHILTEDLSKISHRHNKNMIGKTYKVLVRGKDRKPGFLSALTEGKIIVRFAAEDESLIGQFVNVKITSVVEFATEGELVKTAQPQMA